MPRPVPGESEGEGGGALEPCATLEGLAQLEAMAVIGGGAHVYVLPRLIAVRPWLLLLLLLRIVSGFAATC